MGDAQVAERKTLTYSMPEKLTFSKVTDFSGFKVLAEYQIREKVELMIESWLRKREFAETYANFVLVDLKSVKSSGEDGIAVVMDIQLTDVESDRSFEEALTLEPFQEISEELQDFLQHTPRTTSGSYNDVWAREDSVYIMSNEGSQEVNVQTMIKFVYTCYMYSICDFFERYSEFTVYNFIAEPQGFFYSERIPAVVKVKNVGMDLRRFISRNKNNHNLIAEVLLQVNLVLYYASVLLNLVHGDLHSSNICVKEGERCWMVVPGTRDRLVFSQKVYLIDFDWACFKSGDRKYVFPDAATQGYERHKCRTFRQDFLLVNTSLPVSEKWLEKTENQMKLAYRGNLKNVMLKYKFKNVTHVKFLNDLFNFVKRTFDSLYPPPRTERMQEYLTHFGHFLFSIPPMYFRKTQQLQNEYDRLVKYCGVQDFYITTLNGTVRGTPKKRKAEAMSAAQVLLAQAFSGLTFRPVH